MTKSMLICLIFCFLLANCKSQKFVGEYRYFNDFVNHQLKLNKDSTFTYIVAGDLGSDTSAGKWYISNGKLYLNSWPEYWPYQVIEEEVIAKELIITLKDHNGIAIPGNYITLNDYSENKYFVDSNGEIRIPFPEEKLRSITVYSINDKFTFEIKNSNANRIDITYDSGKSNYLYFINKEWEITRNKLFDSQSGMVLKKSN